jgi:hypothetical protein
MIESILTWARLRRQTAPPPLPAAGTPAIPDVRADVRARLGTEAVGNVLASPQGKDVGWVRDAVTSYVIARLIDDVDIPAFDVRLADLYYRMSLDFSEVALQARNDLIRAPLQEITVYHEGGIRSEELAMLFQGLQAAGVAVIGAGTIK